MADRALTDQLRELVEVLDRHGVNYLFVGGIAGLAHGATRLTHDIDLMPRAGDNLARLAAALDELHAGLRIPGPGESSPERFDVPNVRTILEQQDGSTWLTDLGAVDILVRMRMSGGRLVSFEDVEPGAVRTTVDGVPVLALGLADLIAAKEGVGRPKDHEALSELRELFGHQSG